MLVRLLYASKAAEVGDDGIRSILESSRENNLEHGITGVLCTDHAGTVFLQVLEGARDEVNHLYNNIVSDPRHQDVTLLAYDEIAERRFAGWRMGAVDLNKLNLSTVLRYSERPKLEPHLMSGQAALALLEELVSTAAIGRSDGRA